MDSSSRPRSASLPTAILATLVAAVMVVAVGACGLGSAQDDPFEHRELPFDWRTGSPEVLEDVTCPTMGQVLEDVLADHAADLSFSRVRIGGGGCGLSARVRPREGLSTDEMLSIVHDLQVAFAQNLPADENGDELGGAGVLSVTADIQGVTDVPAALEIASSDEPTDHEAEARLIDALRTVDTRGAESVLLAVSASEGYAALTYPDETSLSEGMAAVASDLPTAMRRVMFYSETRSWRVHVDLDPEKPSGALPRMVRGIMAAHDPWIPQLENTFELYMDSSTLTVGGLPGDTKGPSADASVDILRAADDCGTTPVVLHVGDETHPTGYVAYTCTDGRLEVNDDDVMSSAFTEPVNNPELAAELLEQARR